MGKISGISANLLILFNNHEEKWRKRQESNLPRTPTRPPTGLKPARPTGSGTLPSRRIPSVWYHVNTCPSPPFKKPCWFFHGNKLNARRAENSGVFVNPLWWSRKPRISYDRQQSLIINLGYCREG